MVHKPISVMSWNLKGAAKPDLGRIAQEIGAEGADIVLAQEVQRRQAATLGELLGAAHTWRFKHWSIVRPAEGLAVFVRGGTVTARTIPLTARWLFWHHRRRIAIVAEVTTRAGDALTVVDLHLSSHDLTEARQGEIARLSALQEVRVGGQLIVGGDWNTDTRGVDLAPLHRRGLRDAWRAAHGADPQPPTCWPAGPRQDPPDQHLDALLVGDAFDVRAAQIPADWARFAPLSDHLPVVTELVAHHVGN